MLPNQLPVLLLMVLCCAAPGLCAERRVSAGRFLVGPRAVAAANDREQDGLAGPVRRVRTETAKITVKNGKPVEGPRTVLEAITYDNKGARVDSAYFLTAGGSLTGKEVYKYDERGNMVEMTLHDTDGSLLAKETYEYEFDAVGNWVKMTTAVAVVEGGKLTFEPTEVTYRTIAYFLEEKTIARLSQAAAPAPSPAPGQATVQPVALKSAAPQPAVPQPAISQPASSQAAPSAGAAQPAALKSADKPADIPADKPAEKIVEKPASPERTAEKSPEKPAEKPAEKPLESQPTATSPSQPSQPAASAAQPEAAPKPEAEPKPDGEAAKPLVRGPLKPVSGGILNGKAVSLPQPQYPDMARRVGVAGVVEVEVLIDVSGKIISAKAVKGPAMLQQAAEYAARQARFVPTLLSGQPVKVTGTITYNFTLK
jgi:protein TonB